MKEMSRGLMQQPSRSAFLSAGNASRTWKCQLSQSICTATTELLQLSRFRLPRSLARVHSIFSFTQDDFLPRQSILGSSLHSTYNFSSSTCRQQKQQSSQTFSSRPPSSHPSSPSRPSPSYFHGRNNHRLKSRFSIGIYSIRGPGWQITLLATSPRNLREAMQRGGK